MILYDVSYLPKPNTVEIVLTNKEAPLALTTTAFLIPVTDQGKVVAAVNRRRGVELSGGHIEPNENPYMAAVRECREETGLRTDYEIAIGYLKMTILGEVPEGYAYPHPISYQQFYAGHGIEPEVCYQENDECLSPIVLESFDQLSEGNRVFAREAVRVIDHRAVEFARRMYQSWNARPSDRAGHRKLSSGHPLSYYRKKFDLYELVCLQSEVMCRTYFITPDFTIRMEAYTSEPIDYARVFVHRFREPVSDQAIVAANMLLA